MELRGDALTTFFGARMPEKIAIARRRLGIAPDGFLNSLSLKRIDDFSAATE